MSNDALDLAFARHVRQIGLVTQEQVNAALQTQAIALKEGKTLAFSEILVAMGLLTPAQRETLEKKVKDQQAGVQQLGVYKLVKKLGEGGMGAVYLAHDPAGKNVAVKVLPRHLGTNTEFVKRFKREAAAATQLQHPNIIGAFSTGEDLGYHYYVMEYCDGQPLDVLIQARKTLPVAEAIEIALQVSRGLKYAHDMDIIHRDIKPSNIILAKDGEARILDLGLSKNIGETSMSFKTVTGAVLGTPHYISPEQAQGEKRVDGRSDIYSLGATLYHLLTGKTPFEGATALEILSKHVNTRLPNPQDLQEEIPDPVVQVLERMMAKEPADRYRDCGELITDLTEVSSGRSPKSQMIAAALTTIAPSARRAALRKRPPTIRRAATPSGSKNLVLIGGGVAVGVALLLVVLMSGPSELPRETPPPPPPPVARPAPKPVEAAGFDVDVWEKSLAELPPEARVRAVHARLKVLNAGYDSSESEHQIQHGRVTRLRLGHPSLKNIAPLRALSDLRELDLSSTEVADLSPLKDSKLNLLVADRTKVTDLRPLRTMKELGVVSLASTPLKDLAPLEGMDLARLTIKGSGVTDLSPLKRVRLRELNCDFDAARDTEFLKSMPLLEQLNGVPVEEFWRKLRPAEPAPVAPAAQDPLSIALAALKQRNPDWGGRETHAMENGAVTELTIVALGVTDLTPLAALTSLRQLDVSGYWSTSEKREYRSPLKDLAPLRGLKLQALEIHHTDVADLGPLQGMPLEKLDAGSSNVADLTPLRGMPLKKLTLGYTGARSLTPLVGLPLTHLYLEKVDIADFTPLAKLPLQSLNAELQPLKHAALAASIKSLQYINNLPVAEFLKAAVPPPPPPPENAAWKTALDLMPHIDPARDVVAGPWRKENGRIVCAGGENAVLRLPYEAPAEYDFRIVYTRTQGHCATAQFLVREGRNFFWEMGGYGNSNSGFAVVAGKGSAENPTRMEFRPQDGTRYVSLVEVRRDRVTAWLDGKKHSEWLPSMGELTTDPNWCVDVPGMIGLGNCESQTIFESVQIREVTGRGKLRTTLTTPIDPAFLKTTAAQPAAEQVRRVTDKLKELNPAFDAGTVNYKIENERVTEFSCLTTRVTDAWPIRAFPALKKLDLGEELSPSVLSDLAFLRGLKLQELGLAWTRVSDLAALQGMPLTRLQLNNSGVRDLAPLRGLKITWLSIAGTPVTDLAPLKDLPLQKLDVDRSLVGDGAALKPLRSLRTVNEVPLADFLKGVKEGWTPLFDGRSIDCLRNSSGWKFEKGAITYDGNAVNSAQTKFEFENGDLRIRFEGKGWDSLSFRVRQSGRGATGIFFDGVGVRALEGRPHELIFVCRGEQVTATLDGKPIALTETQPVKQGCLQFNASGGQFRITGLDYRAP